jgi:hypothetical protein
MTPFCKAGTVASQQTPQFPANSKKSIDPTPAAMDGGGRFANEGQKTLNLRYYSKIVSKLHDKHFLEWFMQSQ